MQQLEIPPSLVKAWRQVASAFAKPLRDPDPESQIQRIIHRDRAFIKKIWITFNKERDDLTFDYLNQKANLSAYLLGFHLPNIARMQLLLSRLEQRYVGVGGRFADYPIVQVTDLGAGTGAASQTIAEFLKTHQVKNANFFLYDTSAQALGAARAGFESLGLPASWKASTRGLNLDQFEPRGFAPDDLQIILMSYVWNELYKKPRTQHSLITNFAKLAKTHHVMLFFSEPSNEEHAKFMMKIRDGLTKNGYHALYPCSHSRACPMLAKTTDWCFSETEWKRPKEVELVDRLIELDRSHVSSSGYIMASEPAVEKLRLGQRSQKIVVGRPKIDGGPAFEYLLCDATGLSKKAPAPNKPPVRRGEILPSF